MKSLCRFACLLFFSITAWAAGIDVLANIPADIGAEARILRAEREGYWEKVLVVSFPDARRTLSTSDGLLEARAALNHAGHPQLWQKVSTQFMGQDGRGGKAYAEHVHENVAGLLHLDKSAVARMSTAADLDNLAVITQSYGPLTVTVLATAGARTNALRTGIDAGTYIEGSTPAGTINIMLLTNIRLTDAAMARALITVTEGKTAALQDLKVPSTYTKTVQATGTGTDSIIVVSGRRGPQASYTGGHSRIGELIGKASYEAVVAALGKQDGFFLSGEKRFAVAAAAPANWPPVEGMGPGDLWERRSVETGLPLIVNNRTGREPELDFSLGESVVAVGGERLFSFSAGQSRLFYVDWDRRQGFSQPAP